MENVEQKPKNVQKPEYFLIKITSWQDTTIQGEIEWLNKSEEKISTFNSSFECIALILDALDKSDEKIKEINKWE